MSKRFVGIDLSKKTMEVRILQDKMPIIKWHGKTDKVGRNRLYKKLNKNDCIALEACSMAFVMTKEIENTVGAKVIVLNPRELAIIYMSLKKTDSEDALKLARLIQRIPEEELPVVQPPSEKEENERAIVHEKSFVTKERTRYINRLHSLFVGQGITTITKKDLKNADKRITTIKPLKDRRIEEAERLLEILVLLESQIENLMEEQNKALEDNELTKHVMSVPGVGPDTAMAFLAFIGDGSRFSRPSQVSNYIGLVPKVDCSGDTNRYGSINKHHGCSAVRRVIVQAAWALIRSKDGGRLAQKYQDLKERKGAGIAIVAVARKLGEILWILVKNRYYYHGLNFERVNAKFKSYGLKIRVEEKMQATA